jgi:hypothetical protein
LGCFLFPSSFFLPFSSVAGWQLAVGSCKWVPQGGTLAWTEWRRHSACGWRRLSITLGDDRWSDRRIGAKADRG